MRPIGFEIINNDAYLNGYKLEDLAKKYKTPLYLVDEFSVREAIRDYQKYFRGQNFKSTIVYASKAFLVPKLHKSLMSITFIWMQLVLGIYM